MAGYTDAAFRSVCKEQGAGAGYTEVTSAEGLRRDSHKTIALLQTTEFDQPVAGHIFGKEVESMVEAARMIEEMGTFDWIDINCGCPVRKVITRGAGAALMKDPSEMAAIVRAIKAEVSLPVSVKTRIGFSPSFPDHLTIAKAVEDAGADMLAIHGRLACNFHKGEADLEKIGEVKQALSIPVIGNGGVFKPEDAEEMVRVAGVDGVMLGRGAVGNPWLFRQLKTGDMSPPTPEEVYNVVATHLTRLVEQNQIARLAGGKHKFEAEEGACFAFRPHLAQYLKGLSGRKELMMTLNTMREVPMVLDAVRAVIDQNI